MKSKSSPFESRFLNKLLFVGVIVTFILCLIVPGTVLAQAANPAGDSLHHCL